MKIYSNRLSSHVPRSYTFPSTSPPVALLSPQIAAVDIIFPPAHLRRHAGGLRTHSEIKLRHPTCAPTDSIAYTLPRLSCPCMRRSRHASSWQALRELIVLAVPQALSSHHSRRRRRTLLRRHTSDSLPRHPAAHETAQTQALPCQHHRGQ